MDTRFSSAIHILIMIAGSDQPLTSEAIANSVGTRNRYIIGKCRRSSLVYCSFAMGTDPSFFGPDQGNARPA